MLYYLLWLRCWYNDVALDVGLPVFSGVVSHLLKNNAQQVKTLRTEQRCIINMLFLPIVY